MQTMCMRTGYEEVSVLSEIDSSSCSRTQEATHRSGQLTGHCCSRSTDSTYFLLSVEQGCKVSPTNVVSTWYN